MCWQIYQKLMLSGFLSSGHLCLIHHLKLFWTHAASTASIRKGAIYLWKIGFLMIHSTKNYQYILVILVPVMIRPSLLRTSKSSRYLNSIIWGLILLYFDVWKKNVLEESWKLMLNFSTFSVGGQWGCVRSKKFQMVNQA